MSDLLVFISTYEVGIIYEVVIIYALLRRQNESGMVVLFANIKPAQEFKIDLKFSSVEP